MVDENGLKESLEVSDKIRIVRYERDEDLYSLVIWPGEKILPPSRKSERIIDIVEVEGEKFSKLEDTTKLLAHIEKQFQSNDISELIISVADSVRRSSKTDY